MKYKSTRGQVSGLSFKDAVLMGLATDGGLLLPESIPHLNRGEIEALTKLAYPELAFQIISRFVDDIPSADLKTLIERSYATFTHDEITPVVHEDGIFVLELFHGPTLAFKDVALQLLGNLFQYLLKESGQKMNIIGATSGDTGSAAIYGVRGKENINIFILHPEGKVSPIQELQMTTVTEDNVFNLAIDGTFDDGQRIVKEIFGDLEFKSKYALGAVNSINWARVMAQVVYYFYAYGQVRKKTGADSVYFSVPTGNFGDIFAGYIAKRMGLPIKELILATNQNDILTRFVQTGTYSIGKVSPSISPSMDIQIASNFERYLYYLLGENPERVQQAMDEFSQDGSISVSEQELKRVQQEFTACTVSEAQTLETITDFYRLTSYVLDPHTAVGVHAGKTLCKGDAPLICLSTAHPSKFEAPVQSACGIIPRQPESLVGIESRPKRCEKIAASTELIKKFISERALS